MPIFVLLENLHVQIEQRTGARSGSGEPRGPMLPRYTVEGTACRTVQLPVHDVLHDGN